MRIVVRLSRLIWWRAGWRQAPPSCVVHLRELARDGTQAITPRIIGWDQKDSYQRMVNEVLPDVNG